ncbi:MADS-box transcription factor 47-like [Triticum dicoccoides]|uniref:MADS-box transcription factor 47-like n=1 Tax=Triticum dicoccoides TaxID=85692 RepID=UPI00188E284F|nr:MADS-box transcription factor 47-like [Triticum dicoccoides]
MVRRAAAPKRRAGNGRTKIAIRRIEKKGARQVCFAKRRWGLFNKANELAVMCGAQVAAVTFSDGGKAFSFGHPSAEAVVDRFLAWGGVLVQGEGADDDDELKKLHQLHGELRTRLKEVKVRKGRVEEAMAKERAAGDQFAVWLDPELGDIGEEELMAFAAKLMVARAAVSDRACQVLLDAQNVSRMLQAPPPPQQQLFGGSTFEFGGSSSGNAGMGMQQMQMAVPSTQGFADGMHMHQMLMAMPPPPGLAYGVDMQQMHMSIPPSPVFGAGTEMQQMVMAMQPQPDFAAETEMQQAAMAMPPPPEFPVGMAMPPPPLEFPVGMAMPPPPGVAAGMKMVQQGPGLNMGFPY